MAREISTQDTSEGVAKRGEDGELLPNTHEVELPHGEIVEIKTKPITTGLINELSDYAGDVERLEASAIKSVFEKLYLSDALVNMSEQEIEDTKAPYLKAYLQPFEESTGMDFDDEGNPKEMDRSERAAQMR